MDLVPSKYNYSHKIDYRYSLLNNTLTGALDIIENDRLYLLNGRIEKTEKNRDIIENMVDRGYLYRNIDEEKRLFDTIYDSYQKIAKKRPIRYVFCPTFTCNLACKYCFESDLPKSHFDNTLLKRSFEAVESISKRDSGQLEGIELFGGEPLLPITRPYVEKILGFALRRDVPITIISNGVHASDYAGLLKKARDNIEMVQITLDGPKSINDKRRYRKNKKGSFSSICKGIESLLKNKVKVNLRVNIDDQNLDSLPELYEYVYLKGWFSDDNFSMKPFMVTDHSSQAPLPPVLPAEVLLEKLLLLYDRYPELEELFGFYMFKPLRHILDILNGAPNVAPKFYNCESNLLELMIFCPDGYIYACPESIGNNATAIGRFSPRLVFFEEKKKIWTKRDILNIEKCIECSFSPLCGGGCTYSSILLYGNNKNAICEPFKKVLDLFVKKRGKKLLKDFLSDKD